jgi:hypothetical protein
MCFKNDPGDSRWNCKVSKPRFALKKLKKKTKEAGRGWRE